MSNNRYATKRTGKTEVYPFWNTKDIKSVIEYFKNNELWDDYFIFMNGLLLGRRIGDIVSMKWSDLYYKNGRLRNEITTIKEQKTGKTESLYITSYYKDVLEFYLEKTSRTPMREYCGFIFNITSKEKWIERKNNPIYLTEGDEKEILEKWCALLKKDFSQKRKDIILNEYNKCKNKYSTFGEYLYYEVEYKDIVKWQTNEHRKKLKAAVRYADIDYPVSCHSSRKTFGYWSEKLHPDDPQSLYILQEILAHNDIKTTMKYIGLTGERKHQYFTDISEFMKGVEDGKEEVIDNTPVVSLKTSVLRDIISFVIKDRNSNNDVDLMNEAMKMVETSRILS